MTDIAELVQRLRLIEYGEDDMGDGNVTNWLRNPDGPEAASVIETLHTRIEELERKYRERDDISFDCGFAQAIEMAADTAEEWFFSEETIDLDALIDAIKALKPPQLSVPRP